MKPLITALFFITFFSMPFQANAELNAGNLYQLCKSYDSYPESESGLACAYYVQGILDGKSLGFFSGYLAGRVRGEGDNQKIQKTAVTEAYQAKKVSFDVGFCPVNKSLGQYILVIVQHLQNHPEKHHLHASTEIDMALSQAFPLPCQ